MKRRFRAILHKKPFFCVEKRSLTLDILPDQRMNCGRGEWKIGEGE